MTDTVEFACTFPRLYSNHPRTYMVEMARALGLEQFERKLTVNSIYSYLIEHQELIDLWLNWSADKRSSNSWYFSENDEDWVVGYCPNGPETLYKNKVHACAEFVEIEIFNYLSSF
ncbi:hypothetical protein [Maritalea sp. S77]|uniref:hypothetical protein n=1 Tax=Maritalea sp. S77 TaxID=3415125 RepID=UPI003C7CAB82